MRGAWLAMIAFSACVPSRGAPRRDSDPVVVACPAPSPLLAPLASNPQTSSFHANPLISRAKHVVAYAPTRFADPKRAVDGDYRSSWDAGRPTATTPAWIAIEIGAGPKRLLFAWSAAGSYNYEETDYGSPGAYHVDVSADSTDGKDGTWRTVVDVREVLTHGQAHLFDFAGDRWVKLVVTGVPASSPNGVQLSEIDAHDASAGADDTWFFLGDSITAFAFDRGPSHQPSFAACVHDRHAGYFPMMINGGTGGAKSAEGAAHIDDWIARNPAHFWAIGYGTNDSAGDASDATEFHANMLAIVQHLKAAGRVPILATIPYASDGQHSHVASFNRVIEDLRTGSGLPAGPDLYAWFFAHPDELRDDGIHPNDRGIISMNRLWADAVEPLYPR